MPLISLHATLLYATIALAIAAAVHDVVARTIPHWTIVGIAGAGLLLRISDGGLAPALGVDAVILSGALLLWRAGCLGGGDAKLLGAVALVLPPALLLTSMLATAISGALLALPYIVLCDRIGTRRRGGRTVPLLTRIWRAERFRLNRGGPLPYGVAIAFGTVLTLWSNGI